MISIIDFAKLALYVYRDQSDLKYLEGFIKTQYPEKVSKFNPNISQDGFYEILLDPNIQNKLNNEFYASYFVKVENYQAAYSVIAIRGTVFGMLGNDETDTRAWWKTVFDEKASPNTPSYFVNQAMSLYRQARKYETTTLKIPPSRSYVTGHSLGGAIAALLPTQCGALLRTVTFNAPGIWGMEGVRNLWDFVINFRAKYDFVSAIGSPVGSECTVMIPEQESQAAKAFHDAQEHAAHPASRLDFVADLFETADFFDSVHAQHSMDNLLQVLENYRDANGDYLSQESFAAFTPQVHQIQTEPRLEMA